MINELDGDVKRIKANTNTFLSEIASQKVVNAFTNGTSPSEMLLYFYFKSNIINNEEALNRRLVQLYALKRRLTKILFAPKSIKSFFSEPLSALLLGGLAGLSLAYVLLAAGTPPEK